MGEPDGSDGRCEAAAGRAGEVAVVGLLASPGSCCPRPRSELRAIRSLVARSASPGQTRVMRLNSRCLIARGPARGDHLPALLHRGWQPSLRESRPDTADHHHATPGADQHRLRCEQPAVGILDSRVFHPGHDRDGARSPLLRRVPAVVLTRWRRFSRHPTAVIRRSITSTRRSPNRARSRSSA